jgi:uncharacterized protein (TIGR03067 family)
MNTLLFGLALAVAAPALKDRTSEASILGNWKLTEWISTGGARSTIADGTGVEFRPDGKRIWHDGPDDSEERSYKLYPKTNPAAIDLIRTAGGQGSTVHPAIFKFDGNTLVLVIGEPNGVRPKSIDQANPYMLMRFERIVKKE